MDSRAANRCFSDGKVLKFPKMSWRFVTLVARKEYRRKKLPEMEACGCTQKRPDAPAPDCGAAEGVMRTFFLEESG